jgi:hypothetical protein
MKAACECATGFMDRHHRFRQIPMGGATKTGSPLRRSRRSPPERTTATRRSQHGRLTTHLQEAASLPIPLRGRTWSGAHRRASAGRLGIAETTRAPPPVASVPGDPTRGKKAEPSTKVDRAPCVRRCESGLSLATLTPGSSGTHHEPVAPIRRSETGRCNSWPTPWPPGSWQHERHQMRPRRPPPSNAN